MSLFLGMLLEDACKLGPWGLKKELDKRMFLLIS
jgi:hypothetical protein